LAGSRAALQTALIALHLNVANVEHEFDRDQGHYGRNALCIGQRFFSAELQEVSMWRLINGTRASSYYRNMREFIAHRYGSPSARQLNAKLPELLSKRLRLLGLDPTYVAVAQPETLRRLSETCGNCTHTGACATDLGVGNVTVGMDSYCANGDKIDDLVIKRSNG
jgi:hypothetical protein